MNTKKMVKMATAGLMFVLIFVPLMGLATSLLWNWLMPPLFGLHTITFWQALGLFVLARLLFGRFGPGMGHRRPRFVSGLKDLTPEERERFRRAMEARVAGKFNEPEAGAKA